MNEWKLRSDPLDMWQHNLMTPSIMWYKIHVMLNKISKDIDFKIFINKKNCVAQMVLSHL